MGLGIALLPLQTSGVYTIVKAIERYEFVLLGGLLIGLLNVQGKQRRLYRAFVPLFLGLLLSLGGFGSSFKSYLWITLAAIASFYFLYSSHATRQCAVKYDKHHVLGSTRIR